MAVVLALAHALVGELVSTSPEHALDSKPTPTVLRTRDKSLFVVARPARPQTSCCPRAVILVVIDDKKRNRFNGAFWLPPTC
jgi:hypothetical protein